MSEPTIAPDRLMALTVENVGSVILEEVDIHGAPLVFVEGENGSGKSSLLDGLALALFGPGALDNPVPVRTGAGHARSTLRTDHVTIERTLAPDGRTRLVIKNHDGSVHTGPVAWLKARIAEVSVDPLAFTEMKPADQAATLRRLAGLDLDEFDRYEQEAYNERHDLGVQLRALDAQLAALPPDSLTVDGGGGVGSPDLPTALANLREAQVHNAHVQTAAERLDRARTRVRQLTEQLAQLQEELTTATAALASQEADAATLGGIRDLEPLDAAVATAHHALRDQAQQEERQRLLQQHRTLSLAITDAQEQLDDCRAAKRRAIEGAHWPLPGLSVQGDTVMWGELPLASAETAVQIRVGTAIGFASSPGLRAAIVRHGSLLDPRSLQAIREVASQYGGTVILERVAAGPLTVTVEDGCPAADAGARTGRPPGAPAVAPAHPDQLSLLDIDDEEDS